MADQTRQESEPSAPRRWGWGVASATILLLVLGLTLRQIGPAAPGEVQLLTGPAGSPYHQLGERYAAYLRARGLPAEVVETRGAFDNLLRLTEPGPARAGFVQSAIEVEVEDPARLVVPERDG